MSLMPGRECTVCFKQFPFVNGKLSIETLVEEVKAKFRGKNELECGYILERMAFFLEA